MKLWSAIWDKVQKALLFGKYKYRPEDYDGEDRNAALDPKSMTSTQNPLNPADPLNRRF